MKTFFVTGIGTEVGKTTTSAILVEALQADYWKPIQAGDLNESDTKKVKKLISNIKTIFHPETFRLNTAASPHVSALIDNVKINIDKIILPETKNNLIIEGAGGVMVPLNEEGDLMIDLIKKLKTEVILVSKNYLGSINHTLLTVEALKNKQIKIKGIIFNGIPKPSSEQFVLKHTGLKCLGNIEEVKVLTKDVIIKYAKLIKKNF